MFIEHLQRNLNETDSTNVNSTVNSISTCLQIAAQKSVPSKTLSFKGPKRHVSSHVLNSLEIVKETYSRWKLAGKPRTRKLHAEYKLAKVFASTVRSVTL